jgi:outer membrane lipoprotein-sorting protein
MNSRVVTTLIMFLALSVSAFADSKKAEDIIEKSLKAAGGKEKFENLTSMSLSAEMNVPSQGMDIKINFWLKKPNKMRIIQEIPAMAMTVEAGTDGEAYWAIQPGDSVKTVLPEMALGQVKGQLEGLKSILDSPLLDYKTKNYKMDFVGLEEIDEKNCNVVSVIDADSNKTHFYFDAITNLMYCSKTSGNMQGEEFEVELKYREYQKVDGLFMPKRIEISQNKEVQTKITINNVKLNEPLNDNDFKSN